MRRCRFMEWGILKDSYSPMERCGILWFLVVEASDRGFRGRKISVAGAKEVSRKFCWHIIYTNQTTRLKFKVSWHGRFGWELSIRTDTQHRGTILLLFASYGDAVGLHYLSERRFSGVFCFLAGGLARQHHVSFHREDFRLWKTHKLSVVQYLRSYAVKHHFQSPNRPSKIQSRKQLFNIQRSKLDKMPYV